MSLAILAASALVAGCVVPGVDFDAFEIDCADGSDCPEGYVCAERTCALKGVVGGGAGGGADADPAADPDPDVPAPGPDPDPGPGPDPTPDPDTETGTEPAPEPDPALDISMVAGLWQFGAKDAGRGGEPWLGKGSFRLDERGRVIPNGGWLVVVLGRDWRPLSTVNGGAVEVIDPARRSFEGTLQYSIGDATVSGTLSPEGDHMTGTFVSPVGSSGPFDAFKVVDGAGWTCHPDYIDGDDGCDCGCGGADPDCGGDGCTTSGCSSGACEICYVDLVAQGCD